MFFLSLKREIKRNYRNFTFFSFAPFLQTFCCVSTFFAIFSLIIFGHILGSEHCFVFFFFTQNIITNLRYRVLTVISFTFTHKHKKMLLTWYLCFQLCLLTIIQTTMLFHWRHNVTALNVEKKIFFIIEYHKLVLLWERLLYLVCHFYCIYRFGGASSLQNFRR